MLTDFEILQHGPGQEDAPWPYEAQLYFARQVEAAVRTQDTMLIQQLTDALEGYRRNHDDHQPCDAERAGRARLNTQEGA